MLCVVAQFLLLQHYIQEMGICVCALCIQNKHNKFSNMFYLLIGRICCSTVVWDGTISRGEVTDQHRELWGNERTRQKIIQCSDVGCTK